ERISVQFGERAAESGTTIADRGSAGHCGAVDELPPFRNIAGGTSPARRESRRLRHRERPLEVSLPTMIPPQASRGGQFRRQFVRLAAQTAAGQEKREAAATTQVRNLARHTRECCRSPLKAIAPPLDDSRLVRSASGRAAQ